MYYVIFAILCVSGIAFLTWYDIAGLERGENYLDVIANTVIIIGPTGLSSAVISMLLVNGRDAMGVVLENFKREQFAEGRELGLEEGRELGLEEGRELGREEGRQEMERELMRRIIALEDQLHARSNGEAANGDVVEPVAVKASEPEGRGETRDEMLRRIAALEKAVVELLASRSNGENEKN